MFLKDGILPYRAYEAQALVHDNRDITQKLIETIRNGRNENSTAFCNDLLNLVGEVFTRKDWPDWSGYLPRIWRSAVVGKPKKIHGVEFKLMHLSRLPSTIITNHKKSNMDNEEKKYLLRKPRGKVNKPQLMLLVDGIQLFGNLSSLLYGGQIPIGPDFPIATVHFSELGPVAKQNETDIRKITYISFEAIQHIEELP